MRIRLTRREGMILLNVLLVLAVASVAVLIMVSTQDIEVQRSTRLRDAAQASAYARAGELSAVTALRRDALVAATTEAKKAKNFAEADRIRDELKARGIEIIDTPQGAKWRKV